jgi:hypothetical protein
LFIDEVVESLTTIPESAEPDCTVKKQFASKLAKNIVAILARIAYYETDKIL